MKIIDISKNYYEVVRHEKIKGTMFLSESSVLFQYNEENNDERCLKIFDFRTKTTLKVNLPVHFEIKNVQKFVDIHGYFYIEVSDINGLNCLFASYDRSEYFVRLTCGLESENSGYESVIYHPLLSGIIYANLKIGKNIYTHISMNYGKNFSMMKLKKKNGLCDGGSCNIKLSLPTVIHRNLYFQKDWISAFDMFDTSGNKLIGEHLISFDAGQNWKSVPFSYYHVQILNQGGIALGFNWRSRKIMYSFDEGKTFYYNKLHGSKEVIVNSWKTGKFQNESLILFLREVENKTFLVTHIDFSNILDRTCGNDDYYSWNPPIQNGACFHGREISYKKKKLNSMCVDTEPDLKILKSKPCPCSLDDYRW
ncbi:VPS10 domain-containing receptor SorCS1 [Thelohanellus kitauei]|uniref:VPS10 domain-containing receptor SorCS1 n=1 Tax=Thelohanellus kitauei TaxID=669202 RepID=A0A0C2N289_THEKT|nr:VPS10 domain-containing receptor SorCS1 [Thelohanellus kitauei]